jgi:broad specificity phosphatase PhoE
LKFNNGGESERCLFRGRRKMHRSVAFYILALSACCALWLIGCNGTTARAVTTVFVVRHAEYCTPGIDPDCDPTELDPELGSAGRQRAQELVQVLGKANVEAIYATNTNRTWGTARPLSDTLQIGISSYSNSQQVANEVLSNHAGGVVLIVGHQPSVPGIVNALGGQGSICVITTPEFDNLCMVNIHESGRVNVVRLQYGNSSLPDSGAGANTTIRIRVGTIDGNVLATVNSLIPASVRTGAKPLAYFELPAPLAVTLGSPYVIEWLAPGGAILTWMSGEGNPYSDGTTFGCSGQAIADEDFVFSTYEARMPLTVDQMSADEQGKSRGCGTPPFGQLYQSFEPAASNLTAVDIRLRAGGSFPTAPDVEMTTVFVIRHAERANDSLTADGWARAEQLSHVAFKSGVSAVYASSAARTQQTVKRLADLRGLETHIYTDPETLVQTILNDHQGEVILVAGHQPTVPEIIDHLGGEASACAIGSEYDNLCVVTILGEGVADVISLQYGDSSP